MNERVLVTGGAGYLGSVLCEHLLAAGFARLFARNGFRRWLGDRFKQTAVIRKRTWFGLAEEVWKMGSGEGGHRFAMAFETQAGLQFVGHELEVGRFLEGEELLEEGDGLRRPVGPMVAAGEPGGEVGALPHR